MPTYVIDLITWQGVRYAVWYLDCRIVLVVEDGWRYSTGSLAS